MLDHFFPLLFPKDSETLKILDIRLREVGAKRPLKGTSKVKKVRENKTFFVRRFKTIFKQKCLYLRPLLSITFPQGFRISNKIGHPTSGSGGKKTVKLYLKSEQTHRQTDRRTDRRTDKSTYRKHRPRGPMLGKQLFHYIQTQYQNLIANLFCWTPCTLYTALFSVQFTFQCIMHCSLHCSVYCAVQIEYDTKGGAKAQ